MKKNINTHILVFIMSIIAVGFGIFLEIGNPVGDFRRSQVASTASLFAEEGIDIFYPRLNVMGDPGYFVLEFPIYQALIAKLWNMFDMKDEWGKVLTGIFWIISSLYLYSLCLIFTDRRTSLLTCFLFLFSPISVLYSHDVGIEGLTLCLSILFLYYGVKWIKSKNLFYYLLALVFACICFPIKLPNIAPMYLPLCLYIYTKNNNQFRSIFSPLFILLGLIPLIFALIWQNHSDNVNSLYDLSAFHTSEGRFNWYFGTIQQRFNPFVYLITLSKSLENIFGSYYGGVLVLFGLVITKRQYFFIFYLLSYLFGFFIFIQLHFTHIHYVIPFIPPIMYFTAHSLIFIWDSLLGHFLKIKLSIFKIKIYKNLILTLFVSFFILNGARYLDIRGFIYKDEDLIIMSDVIKKHTNKDDRIMMYWARGLSGGTWDPQLMYLSDRRGAYVYWDELLNKDINQIMMDNGCNYLVLASEYLYLLYHYGKKSNQIFRKRFNYDSLDALSLNIPQQLQEKLDLLELVYLNPRLRIYQQIN